MPSPIIRTALPLLLVLVALTLPACNLGPFGGSAYVWDSSGRRVWTGDGSTAELSCDAEWDFVRSSTTTRWTAGARAWEPDEVIAECEACLPTPRHPIDRPGTNPQFPPFMLGETRTIVCLDPTVVIVSPRAHEVECMQETASGYESIALLKFGSAQFDLANGYLYGRRVDLDDGLTWFSPTLSPEPRPILLDGRPVPIDLPEGRLTFREQSGRLDVGWERPR